MRSGQSFLFRNNKNMMTANSRIPTVLFAQDKAQIFLTIDLADVKDHVLKTEPEAVSFSTEKNGVSYAFSIELFDSVKDVISNNLTF
jgi:hypothetical protein